MKDESQHSTLPRFSKLDPFNPHRPSFECKHEAAVNPPITQEADALFQQALALTSFELWPEQRQYAKAAALYEQAMKLGHWKAQMNLAGAYLKGVGVPQDTEKAIQLTEDLMRKGVPAAWDNMGAYVMGGLGDIKQDATVAYAFWQKAADMGSMSAQTFLGSKLTATHDEPPSFWANRPIGLKMLECAFAQGSGGAAHKLGATLDGGDKSLNEDYSRALKVLHEGVKLGNEDSANYLSSSFRNGDALVNEFKDIARSERYGVLGDALYTNPDLRFPNLDKVLPLPPARLPMWDGKKESLINAAKAVVSVPAASPKPESSPASRRTGRAHIPGDWTLPDRPQIEIAAQFESAAVPETGYWIARLTQPITPAQVRWNAEQVPQRYQRGELFDRSRTGLNDADGRVLFHFAGKLIPRGKPEAPVEHPLVARGIARYGNLPDPPVQCKGHTPCPQTGVWVASVAVDHPMAAVFNQWHRQAYVLKDAAFPQPKALNLDIEARDVRWQWRAQANEQRIPEVTYITMDELRQSDPVSQADASNSNLARLPLGELAATGRTCPQTGWWQCEEQSAPVQNGRRRFFRVGETMPHAVLLGDSTLWQRLKGEQPSHKTATVWKLVDYEEQQAPPASATETALAPTEEPKPDTPPGDKA